MSPQLSSDTVSRDVVVPRGVGHGLPGASALLAELVGLAAWYDITPLVQHECIY